MGTTADKLQALLNSKKQLKETFGLADDLPFSQYAANINVTPGTGMSLYKCAAVGEADSGSTSEMPEPVFYVPLSADSSSALTGQILSKYGSVSFTEVDGVTCAYFQRGGIYSTSGLDISNGLTVATKVRLTSTSDSNTYFYFGDAELNSLGLWSSGGSFELGSVGNSSGGTTFAFSHNIQTNVWYDFAVVYNGSELAFYIDGALVYSGAWAYDVSTAFIGIGCYKANGNISSYSSNYQADFKIFNQAMTAEQVKELYKSSAIFPEPVFAEKFDGSLTNDFTQLGEAPVFETIDSRQCMKCDHDHRLSHSAEALPSGNSPRTMSAWIYCNPETLSEYSGFFGFFVGYGGDADNCYYISTHYNRVCNYSEQMRPNYPEYLSWGELTADTWYHIVMAFDGNVMRCYLDGQEIGNFNINYNTDVTAYALSIGYLTFNSNPYDTSGYISDLQIYDTALTAEQVMKLYDPNYEPLEPFTWNGYKAVLVTDEEGNTYYEFEETLTEGLTYGKGFTPEVDKVYDGEAMVIAELCKPNKYPEIASPMDMTGYTKDDWVVSESDYRFDSTRAWNAFYPNGIWAGYDWLQWQNTAQQVLIRQITFGYGGNMDWIRSCRLEGSDDGNTWTEIGTRDCEYDDNDDTILTYPENETAYYYHRLVVTSSQGSAVVCKLLAKREIDGKNTP